MGESTTPPAKVDDTSDNKSADGEPASAKKTKGVKFDRVERDGSTLGGTAAGPALPITGVARSDLIIDTPDSEQLVGRWVWANGATADFTVTRVEEPAANQDDAPSSDSTAAETDQVKSDDTPASDVKPAAETTAETTSSAATRPPRSQAWQPSATAGLRRESSSSQVFSAYGNKYVFVKNPFSQNVIRTIDGLGGFARTSATSAGVVWRVTGVTGRIIFTAKDGTRSLLEAGEVGARTMVYGPGSITLTETFDRSWQILQNVYRLDRAKDEQSLPQFQVKEAGEISLLHDGTIRRAWLSLQLIAWTLVIILAAPAGRRKREISEKELA